MTDTSKLSAQAAKDLAPIFDRFPGTTLDDDLSPIISITLIDAEEDPVQVTLDMEGNAHLDTDEFSHLIFNAQNLLDLAQASKDAQLLWQNWQKTPTGKAWLADI